MSLRFSILVLSLIGYLIILLSNIQSVKFQFFFLQVQVPLFYIIAFGTFFGAAVSLLIYSMSFSYRRMLRQFREMQQNKSERSQKNKKSKKNKTG